ncbi:MAG: 3'(2'),5'-bisphosphate nucleotidase CysQ, partial [Sulfitobacter sp.]|nr:3'(2'),5'-bisphosphate nucleotidase CysQ [Sulfitobacter sp.]
MNYEKLVTVMRKLSLQAGDAIMTVYGRDDFDVKSKSDDSPVTAADEAADAIISAGLRAAFPDVMLVTEEQSATHTARGDTFLIVDPLDGTKEFIHRRGDFTVNIALVEKGVPTRGVVYAPAKGRMFFTQADGQSVEETGDFEKDTVGTVTPIKVARADNAGLMVVASKSHRDQATDDYIGKYQVRDMTSAGSSL